MQPTLPITIGANSNFSSSLKPLLHELEMWINFQALKADWYGNEDSTLCFDFSLIRSLDEQAQQLTGEGWHVTSGYAYLYDAGRLKTTAFIAIADIVKQGVGIETAIKRRITSVANIIASQHGLVELPSH